MAVLSPAEEGSGGLEGTGSSRGESLDGAQPGSTTPPNPGARKGHRKDVGTWSCGRPPPCSGGILGTGGTQMPGSEIGRGVTVLPLGSCQPS